MVRFTHILYPTDISEAATPALEYAVSLARWYEARLTVLHVVPSVLHAPEALVFPPPPDVVADDLKRALKLDTVQGVTPDLLVEAGDAGPVILDRAVGLGADLIVMGTHGRRGFDRLLHGSVTNRVLQRAPCPVMTIPPHATSAPKEPIFTRILCPIDFSPASQQAYGFALDLASQSNGAVTALHVVEWVAEYDPSAEQHAPAVEYRSYVTTGAESKLRTLVDAEPHDWCEVTPVVRTGRSHREILAAAKDTSANLIVMGAHGRGALGTAVFGSTAHEIVRAATCPVLVVRG